MEREMSIDMLRNFAAALVAAAWLIAAPATMAAEHETDQGKIDSVQAQTAEAIAAIKQSSAAQRNQALARARVLLDELDVRIAKLKVWIDQNWDSMQSTARQHAQDALSRLEVQRANLTKAYNALEASSGSAWEDVKQGFLKSYRTMRKAFEEAKSEL